MLYAEQEFILSDFPNIKLSYENIIHKKVYKTDIIYAIPRGKKCFIWFTEYNNKNVCFLMELGENKEIKNVQIITIHFHTELVFNTILYGTMFFEMKTRLFSIEDIFYYKGQDFTKCNWIDKLSIIMKMLQNDITQKDTSFMFFGLPIASNNVDELNLKVKNVRYRIDSLQFRLFQRSNNYLYTPYEQIETIYRRNVSQNTNTNKTEPYKKNIHLQYKEKREFVFKIKPDIQNDIYHLYCLDGNKEKLYETASIPDFKTSVMMNRLFRNIKENQNLDALEESDDEEEFENESEDRFVKLDKEILMVCTLNYKFKKWVPIRVSQNTTCIVQEKELKHFEKPK
jgi:hypothetical protein